MTQYQKSPPTRTTSLLTWVENYSNQGNMENKTGLEKLTGSNQTSRAVISFCRQH